MTCSYCGCSIADDSEYCIYCNAEQPLPPDERKRFRRKNLFRLMLLLIQSVLLVIVYFGFLKGIFAKMRLRNDDASGFALYLRRIPCLQNDPEIQAELEQYLKELNLPLVYPEQADLDRIGAQYNQFLSLYDTPAIDLVAKTLHAYRTEFEEAEALYEKLEVLKTADSDSEVDSHEVFQTLNKAHTIFDYSDQAYMDLCRTAFVASFDSMKTKSNGLLLDEFQKLYDDYRSNRILHDAAAEILEQIYEETIDDCLKKEKFTGETGAVARIADYVKASFHEKYGNELVTKVHNQFQLYLAECLQSEEYGTVLTVLESVDYSVFDSAFHGNGEYSAGYRSLHGTAVSHEIVRLMEQHQYMIYDDTGALQLAVRYASALPENMELTPEIVIQDAIAYEKEQMYRLINQSRRDNGCGELQLHQSLDALATDCVTRIVDGSLHDYSGDWFEQLLLEYGFAGEGLGWARISEHADTSAHCYSKMKGDVLDYINSKEWLTHIGIGIHYDQVKQTFCWCVIALKN